MGPAAIIGLALSAVSTVTGMMSASSQAKAAASAAQQQFDRQNFELTERQKQADEESDQKKGDRAKEADRELASLRVIAGETGGLGTITSKRLTGEAAYFEGLDIARTESNRSREVASLQRQKTYAGEDAQAAVKSANANARSSAISALAKGVGSGLQIYSNHEQQQAQLRNARR